MASKTISPEKDALMQWHTQAVNITTNIKFEVYFILPALIATNIVMWEFHVDGFSEGGYNMILGQDISTELGLSLKFSEHVIEADDKHFIGYTTPMVSLGTFIFTDLNTGKLHLKNRLLMLTSKKYMNQIMYVLLQNSYVQY